jgi:uncharacterized protein (TIGR00369 family)
LVAFDHHGASAGVAGNRLERSRLPNPGVGATEESARALRTRTVRWSDPAPVAGAARSMTGLELLRAMARGDLPSPPFAEVLGVRLVSVDPSVAVFEFEPAEFMYNPLGCVHGGIVTTLLDSAMGCAFHTTLPAGASYTTLELKVNFLRPVTEGNGPMRAEGRVVHAGGTVATSEARLVDRDGQLFAHGTSTLMALRARAV